MDGLTEEEEAEDVVGRLLALDVVLHVAGVDGVVVARALGAADLSGGAVDTQDELGAVGVGQVQHTVVTQPSVHLSGHVTQLTSSSADRTDLSHVFIYPIYPRTCYYSATPTTPPEHIYSNICTVYFYNLITRSSAL